MESSFRQLHRNISPQNDTNDTLNTTSTITPSTPRGRQPLMPGQSTITMPNTPAPVMPEEPKSNGRTTTMKGGMSHFRAQPPYANQKLRVKQYNPTSRGYDANNDEPIELENQSRWTTNQAYRSTSSAERSQEPTPGPGQHSAVNGEELGEALQQLDGVLSPTSIGQAPTSPIAEDFTPERLAGVVSYCITKCREKHMTSLGLAIKLLWEESRHEPRLSHLLGAVLTQTASEEDKAEIHRLIDMRKLQAKTQIAEHKSKKAVATVSSVVSENSKSPSQEATPPKHELKPATKSPERRTRQSARKPTAKALQAEDEQKRRTPSVVGKRARSQAKTIVLEESRPKRQKTSNSNESDSSLSPVPDDDEQEAEASDNQKATRSSNRTLAIHPPKSDSKAKGPPKKVLGNFDPPKINGKTVNTADEPASVARRQKKQELLKDFTDLKVTKSGLRDTVNSHADRPNSDPAFPNLSGANSLSRGRRRELEDGDSVSSTIISDLLVPPPQEARRSSRSRQATPNAQRPRATGARVSARVKISPNQKDNINGIGLRSSRSKELDVDDYQDDDDDERENNDFCSTCGASGQLLCCDGCIRAFHFTCLDPPIPEDAPPEGLWFCAVCESKRDPYHRARRGLFSMLKVNLRKSNTAAYGLPKHLRDYYEGVGTGDEGEYLDVPASGKPKVSKLPGYDEDKKQDNTKLVNKRGDAILCFSCGESSDGRREIIACDYCGLNWHLDCLNPPLANAPFRDPQNRAKYRWMCPAHADSVINAAGPGGRLYKTRRPRNARVIDTQLRRGFKSNGIIEIDLDDSAEESEIDDEPPVYRVPERSIRLDFNEGLRKDKLEALRRESIIQRLRERERQEHPNAAQAFRARSFIEKQAVSSLVEMAKASKESSLQPDEIKEVIDALLNDAPDNVLALLDSQPAGGMPVDDHLLSHDAKAQKDIETRQLILLRELIGEKLATLGHIG